MRFMTTLGAAVALAIASASALATTQADIPAQPVAGPTPNGNNGNGGLLVAAWDGTKSIVQYLGLNFLDVEKSDLTTSGSNGIHLDFGTLSSFSFANPSAVQYAVFSADNQKAGILGARVTTTVTTPGELTPEFIEFFGNEYAASAQSVANFADVMNGPLGCAGVNPCVATSTASEAYAGKDALGSLLGSLPFTVSAGLGTALQMFTFSALDNVSLGGGEAFAVGDRIGTWLLDANGKLTYDFPADGTTAPVPLPAGVWLLLSGLTGLGIVGRRRKAGEAAVAA